MIPCGVIISELMDQMDNPRGTADEVYTKQVWEKLNEAYRDVCGAFNWTSLQEQATLTDSSYIVPADCRTILFVKDEDRQPYNFMPGSNRASNFDKNWYFNTPVAAALASGTTLAVGEYATSVTATAEFPATTCVGEFIRIGSNTGVYKVATWTSTSALTISDYFRGTQQVNALFQIRPRGTPILAFCDSSGTALTPSGVTVTYVRYPLPLFRDEDIIELPGYAPAVKVAALRKLLAMKGFNQAADRKQDEYLAALSEMKASEPQQTAQFQPNSMFRTRYTSTGSMTGRYVRGLNLINNG
jgi:hypothetical protein